MKRISSSATLFLAIFLPTFWLVFFGVFALAVIVSGPDKSPMFGLGIFRIGTILFFVIGALILYFTLMRLKRVEFDQKHLYVTNFIKNVRYKVEDIDFISETNIGLAHLGHIYLKAKGLFGKRITFLQSRQKFEDFVKSDPLLAQKCR